MATGKRHAKDSVIIAAVSAALLTATVGPAAGLTVGAGCLFAIAAGPDQDQEGISAAEWRIVKYSLGAGFLYLWYWLPYSLAFRHRGASHAPFVGTLTRIVYLAPLWWLLWYWGLSTGWMPWLWCGMALSDLAHWVRDLRGGK